jgi:hypothetical protein
LTRFANGSSETIPTTFARVSKPIALFNTPVPVQDLIEYREHGVASNYKTYLRVVIIWKLSYPALQLLRKMLYDILALFMTKNLVHV